MWGQIGRIGGCITAIAAVVWIGTGTAHAQETTANIRGVSDRLRVSLGAFHAGDAVTRNRNSDPWVMLTASYDLTPMHPSRALSLAVYAEGASGNGRVRTDFRQYRSFTRGFFGIGLATTLRVTPPNRRFGMYGLAGVGGYSLSRRESDIYQYTDYNPYGEDTEEEYTDTLSYRDHIRLGYKLGGGIRFGRGFFLEASYFNLGHLEDVRYSGYGISFGARL